MKNFDQHPLDTPRKTTIKKQFAKTQLLNPSHHQDPNYIHLLGKVRLLQDDYYAEKYKNQSLQRHINEYKKSIESLEYTTAHLREQLKMADEEIKRNTVKNRQIERYQLNLQEISHQIASLNDALLRKKINEQSLYVDNEKLQEKIKQLVQAITIIRKNQQAYKKELEPILQTLTINSELSFCSSGNIINNIQLIGQEVRELKEHSLKTKQILEKARKEHSEELLQARQKLIKLEYDLKLHEERKTDREKHTSFESTLMSDQKLEEIVEEMLKKEDELTVQIEELRTENEELKQNFQIQLETSNYHNKLKIESLEKQLKTCKNKLQPLQRQKDSLEVKYRKVVETVEGMSGSLSIEEQEIGRKYRQTLDENRLLQLKVAELQSMNKMLSKEIDLFKENNQNL